jgi:putative ABC transport system permease protein
MIDPKTLPPRWADRFLEWFCTEKQLEILQGDIHELFAYRLKKYGRFRAQLLYIKDVLDYLRPFALKRNRSNTINHLPMFANYIRLALRTFFKNQVSFLINLVGMSIALGCSITAYVNYQYNTEFDKQQENASKIFRLSFWQETEKGKVPYGVAPIPVANLIRENLREGEEIIQYMSKDGQFRIGDEMFQKQIVYTEPAFTKIFTIEPLYGTLSLADKSNILISDKLAINYFGNTNVAGKNLTQIISGVQREYVIAGVFKAFQGNSSFRFDLLTSYDNYFTDPAQQSIIENNWARFATTFLFLNDKSLAEVLPGKLEQYIKTQNDARPDLKIGSFYVEPFVGMSGRAIRERNQGHWMNGPMPPAAVIAPFAMAGFLLLVACFNFMNNAIAVAGNRLKEIGIRKVIGGRRKELIIQFLSETFVFCLIAMALALILAEYFTAGWNGMWSGIEITVNYRENLSLFVMLATLMVFTALLAGGYPAFYISAFKPIQILRGTTRLGGANGLTKSLLVFQFSISLAAVIFAISFYFNSKFQKEYDLGYSWRNVIQVPLENPQEFDLLKNELAQNALIHNVAGSEHHIYGSSYKAAARTENQKEKEIDLLNVGDNYFETVNVRLLAGKSFQQDMTSDINEAIIVNEEFVRSFQLGEGAIGKRVTLNDTIQVYIKGIVKDVYLGALFQPLSPLAFRYVPLEKYKYFVASTDIKELVAANAEVKSAWKKLFPTKLYPGRLMEANMAMALEHFDSVVILYTFLGLVAIIMSVSGLYSLVSLNLQKRTKELGIRKILGAPLRHIVLQSSKLFIIIMVISFFLGSLLGTVMVNAMMDSVWEYYEAVNVKVLTLAISILVVIAVATIGYKIRGVTVTNPVNSLRHD